MSDIKRVEMRSPVGVGTVQVPAPLVEKFKARGFSEVKQRKTSPRKSKSDED